MNNIRFGFLGAGQIARSSATAINSHPNAKVTAVQDLSAGRLKELCDAFSISKAYSDAESLFADPEIDAVYIAVPNKFHVPLAVQALEAGKHVILEKPFAMSVAEAELAINTAKRVGKVLTLGMNQRFVRGPQQIKTLVEQGALGEIYHAEAFWLRRTGIPKLGTWFGNRELAGGGALNDIGVHVLDLCLYLMGNWEPVSVSGATYTKFGHLGLGGGNWGKSDNDGLPFDVDDFATGFIRFANGATVTLDTSWAAHSLEPNRSDVHLYGDKGGAHAMNTTFFKNSPEGYQVIQNPVAEIRYAHCDRFHNFINHILGTEEICVTMEQALKVQKMIDALNASAACGQEVRLG